MRYGTHPLLRDCIFCLAIAALRLSNTSLWIRLPQGSTYLGHHLVCTPSSVVSTWFYRIVKGVAMGGPFSPSYSTTMSHVRKQAVSGAVMKSKTFARISRPATIIASSKILPDLLQDSGWRKEEHNVS